MLNKSTIELRICYICKIEKPLLEFCKRYDYGEDYYRNKCKDCTNYYNRQYKKANIEKVKEGRKKYYKKNKNKILEARKIRVKKNLEHYRKLWKKYNIKSKDKRRENYKKHKDNGDINRYYKIKYETNINYKITCSLRSVFYHAIKNNSKKSSVLELLGCTIEELKIYLQSMFNEKMNWKNHGKYWHIDHIIPCSSFDMSIMENQKRCFHYTNLQPLYWRDNLVKSDKICLTENT